MRFDILFMSYVFILWSVKAKETDSDLYIRLVKLEKLFQRQEIQIQDLTVTAHQQQREINRLNQIIDSRNDESIQTNVVIVELNKKARSGSDTFQNRSDTSQNNPERQIIRSNRLLVGENIPMQPATIAFYAYLSKNEENIGTHHALVFDVVITNYGNGYNKHIGAFVAPQSGVYVLTLTIFPNRGTLTAVHILRNSDVVGDIFADMRGSNVQTLSGSTGIVVVTMNKDDSATVRTSSTHLSTGDILSDANMKTSFAGWKIGDL
ncbi:unnamed protein product [Mytilus coruscus]|uniref:C1q domain-containing protein n=1 Tax=Mytilus coruscus TaxID=42192 RepID=A0A6J8DYJ8_MYTCO|nr:unnamed protein product [Mytilus coruscus]